MFNLGEYRRQATTAYRSHEFFLMNNEEALAIRNKCASDALEDVIRWIESGGEVAVRTGCFCSLSTTITHYRMHAEAAWKLKLR